MPLFKSNHEGFVQVVRHEIPDRSPITGEVIGIKLRRLAAEFGVFGEERSIVDPVTGSVVSVADVYGGFFDSEAAKEREGWTDEEHDAVVEKLRAVARTNPSFVTEIVAERVPASPPWANYDEMEVEQIPKIAVATGLVPEALRYERENADRADVTVPLSEALQEIDPDEAAQRSAPLERLPEGALTPTKGKGIKAGRAPETTATGIVKGTPGFVEKAPTTVEV